MNHQDAGRVRVRFAPSPTGPLHIGGARSALFNYLFARKQGGTFILRWEDTDLERSSPESEANILESLRWLGIDWDEGVGKGGAFAPYRQTERLDSYHPYVEQLLAAGQAYYCYCSESELEEERRQQMAAGLTPAYSGRCSRLSTEEQQAKVEQGCKAAVRFRVPAGQTVTVSDLVRGEVSFETDTMGDFIILKSDGIPVYNFACVIDDALMQITHVIRGEEHLSNTPRQLLLYQALQLPLPQFAHISLILGTDRSKMSKRHGATSVVAYQQSGFLPEALLNFLALLGWSPPGEQELLTREEMVAYFSLERVARNPAVFDVEKLRWMNGQYLRSESLERITALAAPFLIQAGVLTDPISAADQQWAQLLVESTRERVSSLQEIAEQGRIFLGTEVVPEEEAAAVLTEETAGPAIVAFRRKLAAGGSLSVPEAKSLLKQLSKETGLAGRKLMQPLRVALTGSTHGVDLDRVIVLLGRDLCLARTRSWGTAGD